MKTSAVAPAGKQVAAFIGAFDPAIARLAASIRAALRRRFSTAIELVDDGCNALVMGFGASERASHGVVAVAGYPLSGFSPFAATLPLCVHVFGAARADAQTPPAIIAAIIGGICAVVGPIIAYFVRRIADTYLFQRIPKDRRAAIEGHWSGSMEQEFRGQKVTYPGDLELAVHGRALRGTLHVTLTVAGQRLEPTFSMSGGFLHDRFARFDYVSKARGSVHFGAMILELSPTATELKGNFVAFGAYAQAIVSGPIRLTKVQ